MTEPRGPFHPDRKLTRAQRRELEDGARRRQEALRAAQAAEAMWTQQGGALPGPPGQGFPSVRSGAPTGLPVTLPPFPDAALPGARYARARIAGGAVLALASVSSACLGIYTGGPVLGHVARPEYLVAGGAGALMTGWFSWTALRAGSRRTQLAVAALSVILLAGFVWGALTSVVVAGKVYMFNSPTAQAYQVTTAMRHDIFTLADADTLIGYDDTEARAHYAQYPETVDALNKLADKYAHMDPTSLPDSQFAVVAKQLADGAHYASLAADGRRALVTAEDAKERDLVAGWRQSFNSEVADASTLLAATARTYGITFPGEGQ